MMRRFLVSTLIALAIAAALIIAAIYAFNSGQDRQCRYWKDQGVQWAVDKYCGPSH